jgi:ABC-type multidrug transport system fused ATPase/permease subunit
VSVSLDQYSRPAIRKKLYEKLNSLGIQTLEEPEINNKIDRAASNLPDTIWYFRQIVGIIGTFSNIIVSFSIVVSFAPILIPILIIVSVPNFLVDKKYRQVVWRFDYETTEESRKARETYNALISATKLQEVFINNAYRYLDEKFQKFAQWYAHTNVAIRKKFYGQVLLAHLLADTGEYMSYLAIFAKYLAKQTTVGDVWFQIRTVGSFKDGVSSAVGSINDMFEFAIRIKDTCALFETKPSFEDGALEIARMTKGPKIEFRDVTFKYPRSAKSIFNNLNLSIESGEKIAIVGPNGAGKTTLVRLLCRMYCVNSGGVFINGENINNIKAGSLFDNLGVLFQDFNTYPHLTPRENIILGDPDKEVDEQEVIRAAKDADAYDFIMEYPQKFDQLLTEKYKGGIRPSGGQWQRIALARFFYRNAPLLIFDEPTASIDPVAESKIFNRIYEHFRDKTVIIISHRFSTVRNADRIIVLNNGTIVEDGAHKELLALGGQYAEAFNIQAQGYVTQITD